MPNSQQSKLTCLDPECDRDDFETEYGVKVHMGHAHDTEKLMKLDIQRTAECVDEVPSSTQHAEHGYWSHQSIVNNFGSWNQGVEAAGFEPSHPTPIAREDDDRVWTPSDHINLPWGPNWETQKKKARLRDENTCRVCGADESEYGRNPCTHHIRPRREFIRDFLDEHVDAYTGGSVTDFLEDYDIDRLEAMDVQPDFEAMNDTENLIILCNSCHRSFEGAWPDATHEEFAYVAEIVLYFKHEMTLAELDDGTESTTSESFVDVKTGQEVATDGGPQSSLGEY